MRDYVKQVAVIGIDGGSWNVLRKFVTNGYMPNLAKFINKGVHGNLRSVIPPITGSAWYSLATGLNPGKSGIIDFFKIVYKDYVLENVNSSDFRDKSIWDYLSIMDYKVAVIDYPTLVPAYPINGIMISSWLDRISTYPPQIYDEIKSLVGNYKIEVYWNIEKYNDIEIFLDDLMNSLNKKLKVSKYILSNYKFNLFVDIIWHSDRLQHRMWHYMDTQHPLHHKAINKDKYFKKIAEFWQMIDEYLGIVADKYDQLLIVSDHGFGPQWGIFNFWRWLLLHGYIARKKEKITTKILKNIINLLVKTGMHVVIPKKIRKIARKHELTPIIPSFYQDLEQSQVIALSYSDLFGAIHINPRFKGSSHIILNRIKSELHNLAREIKMNIKVQLWELHKIYHGEKLALIPDLILSIDDWSCVIINYPNNKNFIYRSQPASPRHMGTHRLLGIFVGYGEGIRRNKYLENTSILDIAPTLLYIFGLPIPKIMDGRVLAEIFDPRSRYVMEKPVYVEYQFYLKQKLKKKIRNIMKTIPNEK